MIGWGLPASRTCGAEAFLYDGGRERRAVHPTFDHPCPCRERQRCFLALSRPLSAAARTLLAQLKTSRSRVPYAAHHLKCPTMTQKRSQDGHGHRAAIPRMLFMNRAARRL